MPSSTSSSRRSDNRRFAAAAACAFAAFFAVDWYLFAAEGFLREFGAATQEGQVLSKMHRAPRMAEAADVILFGSSYVRSGVAGEPFLQQGLLPFNFAVSGGGPLYDYFALQRIAPILARRTDKPVLLLELKTDTLQRQSNSAWSEYPQYIAIVRRRAEMLRHAGLLWRNFSDFNLTSQYISGVLIPSGIYRSHAVPLLGAGGSLDGYFYGVEDVSGFSPLTTLARPSMVPAGGPLPPIPVEGFFPGKLAFLRAFLTLARTTGCRVVLYQSPTVFLGRDRGALDALVTSIQSEFGDLRMLRTDTYPLTIEDFDEGGHPNIRGSDKMGRYLIGALGIVGDPARLAAKTATAFEMSAIPAVSAWSSDTNRIAAEGDAMLVRPAPGTTIAQSPPIAVTPGREWVFEAAVSEVRGRFTFLLTWVDPGTQIEKSQVYITPELAPAFGPSMRVFLRAVPTAAHVTVRITDYQAAIGAAPSAGRVVPLRLWASR